jgi:hypothetical protein
MSSNYIFKFQENRLNSQRGPSGQGGGSESHFLRIEVFLGDL